MRHLRAPLALVTALAGLALAGPSGVRAAPTTLTCPITFATLSGAIPTTSGSSATINISNPSTAPCLVAFTSTLTINSGVTVSIANTNAAGSGPVQFDGGSAVRLFDVNGGGVLTLSGLTLQNGSHGEGGALTSSGTTTILNSTFTGNKSDGEGGAIDNNGTMLLVGSTLTNNSDTGDDGGAIENDADLTVVNSTISGNTETGEGGGIDNEDSSTTLTLINSTVSGNTADDGGGIYNAGTVTVGNSIIAGNTFTGTGGPDYSTGGGGGTLIDLGHNLIGDDTGTGGVFSAGNGDLVGTAASPINPMLGPLANNGGPTQTMALLPSSQAINLGSAAICETSGPSGVNDVDQRGLPRYAVLRGMCDSGAYDTGGSITPPLTLTGAIPLTTGVPARLGFAASNHGSFLSPLATSPAGGILSPFNIGYITFQLGASTFTVRQPVSIACTSAAGGLDHCFGTTGLVNGLPGFVAVPGTATVTLSGTISSARGVYQQGQTATVTLTVNVSAAGALTVSKVTVAVAGVNGGSPVATWTSLPAGTSLQIDKSAPLIL